MSQNERKDILEAWDKIMHAQSSDDTSYKKCRSCNAGNTPVNPHVIIHAKSCPVPVVHGHIHATLPSEPTKHVEPECVVRANHELVTGKYIGSPSTVDTLRSLLDYVREQAELLTISKGLRLGSEKLVKEQAAEIERLRESWKREQISLRQMQEKMDIVVKQQPEPTERVEPQSSHVVAAELLATMLRRDSLVQSQVVENLLTHAREQAESIKLIQKSRAAEIAESEKNAAVLRKAAKALSEVSWGGGTRGYGILRVADGVKEMGEELKRLQTEIKRLREMIDRIALYVFSYTGDVVAHDQVEGRLQAILCPENAPESDDDTVEVRIPVAVYDSVWVGGRSTKFEKDDDVMAKFKMDRAASLVQITEVVGTVQDIPKTQKDDSDE